MEINKEEFEAYVSVQKSGITNMFDVKVVGEISGLNRDQIMAIMLGYRELENKYNTTI
tara:strand:- start:459 stop:632 length:174 start_codon:yes stop_codon:yes gene_type:complete